jgi:peroxiredoxin family protein
MKIQLDHKALVKLIEEDEEFKLELKKNILETTCKHTIKSVVNEEAQKQMAQYVQKNISKQNWKDLEIKINQNLKLIENQLNHKIYQLSKKYRKDDILNRLGNLIDILSNEDKKKEIQNE